MKVSSLPYSAGPSAHVVILGSMPGNRSLEEKQYYAHPRNRFWPLMEKLYGVSSVLPYHKRLDTLSAAGVALWDVLMHCQREGSLDNSITIGSEVPNDFVSFFNRFPSIGTIGLNGAKAARAFRQLVQPKLPADLLSRVRIVELPSTSPANARSSIDALAEVWRNRLGDI